MVGQASVNALSDHIIARCKQNPNAPSLRSGDDPGMCVVGGLLRLLIRRKLKVALPFSFRIQAVFTFD